MESLTNKSNTVLVTGTSSGIGRGLCQALIKKGYKVFGTVRNRKDATELNKEFGEKKKRLLTNAKFHSSLQGMEDGFYVTVSYDAKFKNTFLFKETVILKQDDQAKWRILDYSYEYQLKQDDDPTIKEK